MEKILINDHRVDKTMAKIAASLARGSLEKAMGFAGVAEVAKCDNLINWPKTREWIITATFSLISGNDPGTAALALAERLSKTPETLDETLTILESFLRDMVVFNLNPGSVINLDFHTLISKTAPGVSTQQGLGWIDELGRVRKKIKANAGIRLTLEAFLFTLMPAGQYT
jgi:DNA polymerase-3 subunit delta'